jgi:hypothetical protein
MTLPRKVIGIFGMVHVLFVTYSLLVVMMFLSVKPGAMSALTTAVKSYGVLLYLIPLLWTMLSAYYLGKPEPARHAATIAFWSWVLFTVFLLVCDVVLTITATGGGAAITR